MHCSAAERRLFCKKYTLASSPSSASSKTAVQLNRAMLRLGFRSGKFTRFSTARRYKICRKKRRDTKFRLRMRWLKLPSQHGLARFNVASQYKILSHDAAFHIKISPRGNALVKNAIRCARQRARIPPRHNIAAAIITNCYTHSDAEFYLDNLAA